MMRTGSSSRVDRRAPAISIAWLCVMVLVTRPLIAQPVARAKSPSPQVVALERRVDVPCDMPGPGWSNLFFASDSIAAGERVARFAEGSPGPRIDIVERTASDDGRTYAVRVPGGGPDVPLDFVRRQPGRRCATLEVPVGRAGAPTRLQVAIPDAEPYVYGRLAEYRVGQLGTRQGPARIELWPINRGALGFDDLARIDLFAGGGGGGAIRRQTLLDSAGTLRFGDAVSGAFARGGRRFTVDSVSAAGTRLHLTAAAVNASVPARGFHVPAFTGTRLDGTPYRLPDRPGRVTVIEFWSTECPFSERARPEASRLSAALVARGGVFISMARETDRISVKKHLDGHPRAGLQVVRDSTTWATWNPRTITPLYYVIAADGTILLRESGASAVRLAAAAAGVAREALTTPSP